MPTCAYCVCIMSTAPRPSKSAKVVSIHQHAYDNLRFIRETMENASAFTAVPGWGGILMGISALLTSFLTTRLPSQKLWFAAWMGEAILADAVSDNMRTPPW